jgi:hypothetical protein
MGQNKAAGTIYSNKTVMGLPVKNSFMFTNPMGVEKKGIKKRQLNLLKKLEFLPRFLKADEEVYLVTTACSPISIMEQLTTGWIVFYVKRALLVFTNKRIIHIPTTVGYNFRDSIANIQYNDIKDIKFGWGALKIQYKNKKKERFVRIRKERAKIKQFIKKLDLKREASKRQQRYHICPSCMRPLKKGEYRCAACGLEFKSSGRARLLSLVIPGGGYFYTGHWFLGIMDFIVEAGLIFLVLQPYLFPEMVIDAASMNNSLFFLGILGIEKIMTIYHASHYIKEYIPVTTKYKKRVAA